MALHAQSGRCLRGLLAEVRVGNPRVANSLPIFAGLDSAGVIRFVGDVPRGAACGCTCSACGAALIARRGDVNKWHFSHEVNQERPECFAGAVNLLRRLAIQVLCESTHLALPPLRLSVSTKAPLPALTELVEYSPGHGRIVQWENPQESSARPTRSQHVAVLELASGTQVRLFVEAGSGSRLRMPEAEDHVGSLVFTVPLPTDTTQLGESVSAMNYIVEMGDFEWRHLPDAATLVAQTRRRLEQRAEDLARARARVQQESAALHRIQNNWAAPEPVPPPSVPLPTLPADSPWNAWRKPRSSFIFYGLNDGSAWLLMQHQDGRTILIPWPKADDGWDEQLPARLGTPDLALGGVVLFSEVNAMIYLRGRAKTVRTSGEWGDILQAATAFR